MSHPLYIAFIWHQHQPLYKSRSAGKYRLPWVRLHGTKDYLDLVLILSRYPKLHQTVNLVPSLILQLEDYIEGKAFDPYLEAMLTPTDKLTEQQRSFVLKHFFDANYDTAIAPHPRYAELFEQRRDKGLGWCMRYWTLAEFGDLIAWHNLAWFDPIFADDPEIAAWLKQERFFSLSDRQRIYAKQQQILAKILPQHRQMQEAGQLEIMTTPYTHPILPLLADTDAGRVAIPDMVLPEKRFQWPEDIPRHLQRAVALYRDRFGREPKGLWPSEQSVSPAILPYIAAEGFQWICADEAVLGWTLKHFFHRDEWGNVAEPELLYRPYRLETDRGDLSIVFRDHRLSDLIGFTYSPMEPQQAANDLIGQLEAIAHHLQDRQRGASASEPPSLVTIALDGENCWEFYEKDGLPFLEALYERLERNERLQLVTVGEFLARFPATKTLPSDRLHSGSWVDGSFSTWIGDPVKNRAWDLLAEARETLARHPEATEESNPEAWEALFAAEGSDWFWWFGEGHSSNQDAIFDRLFREHLTAIYMALGEPVPESLQAPLEHHEDKGDRHPRGLIHPPLDGRGNERDWEKAGRIEIGGSRGTMHRSSTFQRLFFGVDLLHFYLRLDCKTGARLGVDCPQELHVFWYYPDRPLAACFLPLRDVPDEAPLNYCFHRHLGMNLLSRSLWFQEAQADGGWHSRPTHTRVSLESSLEIAVPRDELAAATEWPLRAIVVLGDEGQFRETLLEGALIPIDPPSV